MDRELIIARLKAARRADRAIDTSRSVDSIDPTGHQVAIWRVERATLVEAMKASVAYCNTAYQMSDADAMKETQFFGSTMTRLAVLVWNVTHDGEHYGNLVVYMRANGMVPPSSQGGS